MAKSPFLPAAFILASTITFSPQAFAQEPYKSLIAGSGSKVGPVTVHLKEGKVLFEVPVTLIGKDLLWHVEAAGVPAGYGKGTGWELASHMVRWSRQSGKLLLSGFDASIARRGTLPRETPIPTGEDSKEDALSTSLRESGVPPVLFALPIIAVSSEGGMVVDATGILLGGCADFKFDSILAMGGIPAGALDPNRSYIGRISAYPRSVGVTSHVTYATPQGSKSFAIRNTLTLLPDKPMRGRLFDSRVGFFPIDYTEFSSGIAYRSTPRQLIARYRLEKKNPEATLSEPVKPIVYYVSREVPEVWRPYFIQAIEDWNVAFEKAGFKNAIVGKVAPTKDEDPDWDPTDTQHSVIRWITTSVPNAMGPHISDPRSGEILSGHVLIWSDVLTLVQQWYYTMCAGTDPEARQIPMNEKLLGRLLRYAVAHEVGHSIGLRHNHVGSTAYTIDQLRDPAFTLKNGTTSSIMAYGRFNYVAQPGDKMSQEALIPKVGPYDCHAIKWGYSVLPGDNAKDEFATLDAWASEAQSNRWLQFGGEDVRNIFDPQSQMENIGSDRVEATRLGLLNLERATEYLYKATTPKGAELDNLRSMYSAIAGIWREYLGSVASVIGGVEDRRLLGGRGVQTVRVSATEQRRALKFLLDNAFHVSKKLMPLEIENDLNTAGIGEDYGVAQRSILQGLLAPDIAGRMHDARMLRSRDAYQYRDFVAEFTRGLFADAGSGESLDPMRANLHRIALVAIGDRLSQPSTVAEGRKTYAQFGAPANIAAVEDPYLSDYRAVWISALRDLQKELAKGTDPHRQELAALCARALAKA